MNIEYEIIICFFGMVERCVTLGSVIYCVGVCVEGQKGENGLQALVSNDGDESEE